MALTLAPLSGMAQEPSPPSNEAVDEAKRHYARGVELYNEGSFSGALVELERANTIAPNYRVNYNLGLVHLQLGDFVSALRSFEQYLASGSSELPAPRVAEVEERIKHLKSRIALIEVIVNVPDARITIDDMTQGRSPLPEPVAVNPGRHKVVASKAGYVGDAQFVSAAGQDRIRVEIRLENVVAPAPAPRQEVASPLPSAPSQAPPQDGPKRSSVPWLGILGTGMLTAGAVTAGVLALGDANNLAEMRNQRATPGSDLEAADSRARTFALVSDICAVGAVAAAGITLFLWLKSSPGHRKASATLTMGTMGATGAALSGRF